VTTGAAFAATVTVTPTDTSWGPSDTRPGGAVSFSAAYGAPAGLGTSALRLTTTNDNAAKADYWTASVNGTPLSQVNALAYWTYQAAASFAGGDASLQLAIDVNGADPGGFTTLVYEPYWNGAVTNGAWQHWDATGGQWWSTKTVGTLVAGGGGPPLYTIAQVAAGNPNAVVLAIGVNVGSYNPGYDVATDGVQFNDTTWNFELPPPMPTTKDQCKDGGWQSYGVFKNQGDCVSWVQTGGANAPG
jgi:hypothetical protein